jgi:hypothetical protein
MMRRRRPEAVRALEALQQQERGIQGVPPITTEMVIDNLRENLIQQALMQLSPSEMISGFERAAEQAEKQLAEILARTDVTDAEEWSRYEQPFVRIHIARACESVEDVFVRRGWPMPEPPVVGTLATGQISAQVQPGAADTVLILIENGFFKFAGVMSQLVLFSTMEAESRGGVSEVSLQALADLVSTHAFLNSCLFMYPRNGPPELAPTVDLLQHAVVVFVIAHEYAHIAAGDAAAGGGGPPPDLRAREFEADRQAALAAIEAIDAEARERGLGDAGPGIMAPFVFLAGLDILSRAEAAIEGATPIMETTSPGDYPTCFERARALLNLCDSDLEFQSRAHQAQIAIESYIRLFWLYQQMHPLVVQAKADYGPLNPKDFGTPIKPSYAAHSIITDFWDRVRAHFTGRARGDTIREQLRGIVAQMREGGEDVSDLEEMVETAPWGQMRPAGPCIDGTGPM